MARTPEYAVTIDGEVVQSADQLSLRFSMTELADSFSVQVNDRGRIFRGGERAEVSVLGRVVLVGEVMTARLVRGPRTRSWAISGFSAAQRMVKSDVLRATPTFEGNTLAEIVRSVAEPFGLALEIDPSAKADAEEVLERVRVDNGEKAWDFLRSTCERQGCLLVSGAATVDAGGVAIPSVRIARVATRTSPIPLVYPSAAMRDIDIEFDVRAVHSQLTVTPRGRGRLDDDGTIKGASADAFDERVRYSPLIIQARKGGRSEAAMKRQVEWELRRRAGESQRVSVVMKSWSPNASQALWWPNTIYNFIDQELSINQPMLVTSAELVSGVGGDGALARVELVPPDTWAILEDNRIKKQAPVLTADPGWLAQQKGLVALSLLAGGSIGGADVAWQAEKALLNYVPEDPNA